ncbi:hypothetical protein TURU_144156 [Turdus rufiventris]|nr:hypothetical protein TURU_144156 [Turdus rufiventris]
MGRRRLLAAAEQLAGVCPGQARFLLVILNTKPVKYLGNEHGLERICPYCFQFLAPDTYRVRLKPKMKVTPQIEKILKREAKNHKLNMKQTKLLRKTRESGQSTSNSASKTPRNSKFHFSKLKRMLDLEEKEKSQKADFKTFLTLL